MDTGKKELIWLVENKLHPLKFMRSTKMVSRELYENKGITLSQGEDEEYYLEAELAEFGEDGGDNILNENERWYDKISYLEEVDNLQDMINDGRLFGAMDHDPNYVVKMKEVSHMITRLWFCEDTQRVKIEIKLLPTILGGGMDAIAIVKAGGTLSLSARAVGYYDKMTKKATVDTIFTVDIVSTPGFSFAKTLRIFKDSTGSGMKIEAEDQEMIEQLVEMKNMKSNTNNMKTNLSEAKMPELEEITDSMSGECQVDAIDTQGNKVSIVFLPTPEGIKIISVEPTETVETLGSEVLTSEQMLDNGTLDNYLELASAGLYGDERDLNESDISKMKTIALVKARALRKGTIAKLFEAKTALFETAVSPDALVANKEYFVRKGDVEIFAEYVGEENGIHNFNNSGEITSFSAEEFPNGVFTDYTADKTNLNEDDWHDRINDLTEKIYARMYKEKFGEEPVTDGDGMDIDMDDETFDETTYDEAYDEAFVEFKKFPDFDLDEAKKKPLWGKRKASGASKTSLNERSDDDKLRETKGETIDMKDIKKHFDTAEADDYGMDAKKFKSIVDAVYRIGDEASVEDLKKSIAPDRTRERSDIWYDMVDGLGIEEKDEDEIGLDENKDLSEANAEIDGKKVKINNEVEKKDEKLPLYEGNEDGDNIEKTSMDEADAVIPPVASEVEDDYVVDSTPDVFSQNLEIQAKEMVDRADKELGQLMRELVESAKFIVGEKVIAHGKEATISLCENKDYSQLTMADGTSAKVFHTSIERLDENKILAPETVGTGVTSAVKLAVASLNENFNKDVASKAVHLIKDTIANNVKNRVEALCEGRNDVNSAKVIKTILGELTISAHDMSLLARPTLEQLTESNNSLVSKMNSMTGELVELRKLKTELFELKETLGDFAKFKSDMVKLNENVEIIKPTFVEIEVAKGNNTSKIAMFENRKFEQVRLSKPYTSVMSNNQISHLMNSGNMASVETILGKDVSTKLDINTLYEVAGLIDKGLQIDLQMM